MNLFAMSSMIRELNFSVDRADSGQKAADLAASRVEKCKDYGKPMYKVILLDYSLGDGFDGPDVAVAIRALIDEAGLPQPYICCCSAYTSESYKRKALEAGMDNFVTKPLDNATVLAIVARANSHFAAE